MEKGLSLTELLVATSLIGIVTLGVISFSVTVSQFEDSGNKFNLSMMQVQAAMQYMIKDASMAVGEEGNWGIWWDDIDPRRAICFRREASPSTPGDYSDDRWACYDHGSSNGLQRCELNFPVNDCRPWPGEIPILQLNQSDFFEVVTDADGKLDYIDIMLNTDEYSLSARVSPVGHSR